jgi:CHAD domain-containing protein
MEGNSNTSVVPTARFAREQADRLLGLLAVQIARTIRSHGAAEVHDLRVAIRRFLSVLAALKPGFPRHESAKIRRELKKIMPLAGNVRDRDIALRLLAKCMPQAPGAAARRFQTERQAAAKALTVSLKRWVRRSSSAAWRTALNGEAGEGFRNNPVGATATAALPRAAKEYFRCGRNAVREKASAEELHRFRLAAKNLRYTLEVFAPVYGDSVNGLRQQLKGVQTLLGAINDCATVRRMASRLDGCEELVEALKKRQRKKTAEFREHWAAAFSSGTEAARWMECLRNPAGARGVARKPPSRSAPLTMAAGQAASA